MFSTTTSTINQVKIAFSIVSNQTLSYKMELADYFESSMEWSCPLFWDYTEYLVLIIV